MTVTRERQAEIGPGGGSTSTPSQTVGPFFSIGFRPLVNTVLTEPESPGSIPVVGCICDGAGAGVTDAIVEIFQADERGQFASDAHGRWTGFGRSLTSDDGSFGFVTVKPGRFVTSSGATNAPHLEVLVFARGLLRSLRTRMYFPDETEVNALDPVLSAIDDPARRATLIARHEGAGYRFDINLQACARGPETVFFVS